MASDIRLGQLITPFGPGSIYTDKNGVPNIICGLDFWFKKIDDKGKLNIGEAALRKHVIDEPRLSVLLNIPQFRQPPHYCNDGQHADISYLEVQTHRFPTWYVDTFTGQLRRFNLSTQKLVKGLGKWRPVRFISVCAHGHIDDFPWKQWCECNCSNDEGLCLNDSGGPDLRSVKVHCKVCKKSKTLSGAMFMERDLVTDKITGSGLAKASHTCSGMRPWLGKTTELCHEYPVAVLINQSNIYFGKTLSSIYLPDLTSSQEIIGIQEIIRQQDLDLHRIKMLLQLDMRDDALQKLRNILQPHYTKIPSDDQILEAFESLSQISEPTCKVSQPASLESTNLKFRRAEYNVLRQEVGLGQSSELCVIPSLVPQDLKPWLSVVNLVERLRETRVFCGFDRLIRSKSPLEDVSASAMNQLFLHPPEQGGQWLPAIKNYGEGLYVELSEDKLRDWLVQNADWLKSRLDLAFVGRMSNEILLQPPKDCTWHWAARYLLVHTLSHILINQLVFECGYSSASLKERIFVSNDEVAPMAAFLIYTAAGDSEGSLGGLVRLGRPKLFEPMIRRAVARASWCSADPVCSEDLGGSGSRLVNKAACHACVLLPETACETINSGLDRAMVVGTPNEPQRGFFADLTQRFTL